MQWSSWKTMHLQSSGYLQYGNCTQYLTRKDTLDPRLRRLFRGLGRVQGSKQPTHPQTLARLGPSRLGIGMDACNCAMIFVITMFVSQ